MLGRRRLVGIMERVQAGLLGQTVSAFGITGLYITFVLSAGRFLRLAISNMRMRIPYDDLPNTSRLIALCQARCQNICRGCSTCPHSRPRAPSLQDHSPFY